MEYRNSEREYSPMNTDSDMSGETGSLLSSLEDSLSTITEQLSILTLRISPVMEDPSPEPGSVAQEDRKPTSTHLGNRIMNSVDRAELIRKELNGIISRVNL